MRKYTAVLVLFCIIFIALGSGLGSAAFAETSSFSNTYVMNDLEGATIDGKPFDVNDYPADPKGDLRLLVMMEYSFSTKFELQGNYGLYLYVYNPRKIAFSNSELNKLELATEYKRDGDAFVPTKYDKLHVVICSMSSDSLFVKLKVENVSDIYDRVARTPNYRQYDFIGIELIAPGEVNARDYKIAGTWIFSGFAAGCNDNEESSLTCHASSRQVLDLDDLQFTFYRNWLSDWSGDRADGLAGVASGRKAQQLTSVYFSVPNYFAENYARLYSIQAETYKYLTSPIVVLQPSKDAAFLDSDALYNDLLAQRGIATPHLHDSDMDRILYWDHQDLYGGGSRHDAMTGYNFLDGRDSMEPFTTLAWVFQSDAAAEISVTSSQLQEYMKEYSDAYDRHTVLGKYAGDLFTNMYYSYAMGYPRFESGYLPLDIDVSGEHDYSLLEADSTQSGWDKFWNGTNLVQGKPFSPIVEVHSSDLKGLTNAQISEKYHIDENEVDDFKSYVQSQIFRTVYLFHFAQSDYFSTSVYNNYGYVGYMAQEVAYLDFDIISLGFEKPDGDVDIIPCVSDPVDIVSGIQSGVPISEWDRFLDRLDKFFQSYWWVLLIPLGLIVLGILSIFFPVLRVFFKWLWIGIKWIFKILWYIISAPARLVVLIANKVKEKKNQ